MLLDKFAKVRWNPRNKSYYVDKSYNYTKIGDIFLVKVDDLLEYSRAIVSVKCDFCDDKKSINYCDYLKSVKKFNKYSCNKSDCIQKKISEIDKTNIKEDSKYIINPLSGKKVKNRIGIKYGMLTVTALDEENMKLETKNGKKNGVRWLCSCECGKSRISVLGGNLQTGSVLSCGCLGTIKRKENLVDMSKQRIGRLFVKKLSHMNKDGKAIWICDCDCGKKDVEVLGSSLRNRSTISCGCYRKDKARKDNFVDITGERIGRLTVLAYMGMDENVSLWLCECDCGNLKIISKQSLNSERTKSCGCYQKEQASLSNSRDISEKRFGRLIARYVDEEETKKRKEMFEYKGKYWYCECDCGGSVIVPTPSLLSGNTRSCGCLFKEELSIRSSKDITGERFGKLIAICIDEELTKNKKEETNINANYWKCRCDCGKYTSITVGRLTSGNTRSCGCLSQELLILRNKRDITGEKFGKLVAISINERVTKEKSYKTKVNNNYWNCKCECGKEAIVEVSALTTGNTKSCGCLNLIKMSGENNVNWKGGITETIIYLRRNIVSWKKESILLSKYKCEITNYCLQDIEFAVHHKTPFNEIVQECFKNLDINIKKSIGHYTKIELESLKKECIKLHNKHGLGAVIHSDLHRLYHSLYNIDDCNIETFKEFKQMYSKGLLDKYLSDNLKYTNIVDFIK